MITPGSVNPLLMKSAVTTYSVPRSLRFNSADSAYLSRTPASAGNRKTWTWAGWVKRSALSSRQNVFGTTDASFYNGLWLEFFSDDTIRLGDIGASALDLELRTSQVFRDPSSWGHLVIAVDTTQATASDRIKLYWNGNQITAFSTATYPSQNFDTRLNTTSAHGIGRAGSYNAQYLSGYLADIHFIDGQALTPTSFGEFDANGIWQPKAYTGSYGTNGFRLPFSDNSTAVALGTDTSGNGNDWTPNNLSATAGTGYARVTGVGDSPSNLFDLNVNSYTAGSIESSLTWNGSISLGTGKFYAICNAYGSFTQGPSSVSLTVNGTTYTTNYTTLRANTDIHNQQIGSAGTFTSTADGRRTSLTPSITNAELTNISCAATGSGFPNVLYAVVFIPSGVGDTSFSSHVVVHNVSAGNDSLVDSPTNGTASSGGDAGGVVVGNYCTWNPLDNGGVTLANGNLDTSRATLSWSGSLIRGVIGVSTGKWYWEVTQNTSPSGSVNNTLGICKQNASFGTYVGGDSSGWGYDALNGFKHNNSSGVSYGASWTSGDVIGIAFDADAGTLTFYKNGVSQGQAFSGLTSGPYFPAVSLYGTVSCVANFGARPFAYAAPSGFKSLNTANLPTPTILKGSSYFDTKLYTGNGSTQTISGLDFSGGAPDLVWIKGRSGATQNEVYDAVRGANKGLYTNLTTAEETHTNALTAFTSDGFSLGNRSTVNTGSATYAAWCWDAGSSTVTNTAGSISAQVRANASAGFSVVTWSCQATAGTVGHGLGTAPSLILMKDRSATSAWFVYHKDVGTGKYLQLHSTAATTTNSIVFTTAPTSTIFDPGTAFVTGGGYTNTVAYCFAPVAGYSAFGSYTGNGSSDGPFVYTGFRPRWILIKNTSATANWVIQDTARSIKNIATEYLLADSSAAEGNSDIMDITSNGFKQRNTFASNNASGNTYVWAAFAENPFSIARAR